MRIFEFDQLEKRLGSRLVARVATALVPIIGHLHLLRDLQPTGAENPMALTTQGLQNPPMYQVAWG